MSTDPIAGARGQRQWTQAFLPVALRDKYAPSTIALAMALIELHFNRTTGQCDPGYPKLAAELECAERTIIRAVNELQAGGWVKRHRLGRKDNVGFTLTMPDEVTTVVTSEVDVGWTPEVTRNASRGDKEGGFEVTTAVTANEHLNTLNTSASLRSAGARTARPTAKATRMIEGWKPSQEAWDYASQVMPKGSWETLDYELSKFIDHWLADAGPRAYKRDWNAAWRRWARNVAEFKHKNGNGYADNQRTVYKPTKLAFEDDGIQLYDEIIPE